MFMLWKQVIQLMKLFYLGNLTHIKLPSPLIHECYLVARKTPAELLADLEHEFRIYGDSVWFCFTECEYKQNL